MMVKRLLMMALGCFVVLTAPGRTFPLDLRAPAERTNALLKNVKYQRVSLDGVLQEASLDAGTADVGAVEVGDTLSLTLFANVSIDLVLKEKMPSPLGGDAFIAEVSGYDGIKTAVVLRTADGLSIDIQDYTYYNKSINLEICPILRLIQWRFVVTVFRNQKKEGPFL